MRILAGFALTVAIGIYLAIDREWHPPQLASPAVGVREVAEPEPLARIEPGVAFPQAEPDAKRGPAEFAIGLHGKTAEEQAFFLSQNLPNMSAEEIAAVLAVIEAEVPKDSAHSLAWQRLGQCWALVDGSEAIAFTTTRLAGDLRLEAGDAVLRGWMTRDPAAAAAATVALPEDYGKDYIVYAAARRWTERDPSAAMTWARSAPQHLREKTVQHASLMWAERDVDGLARWLTQHADLATDRPAVQEVATVLTRRDAAAASSWAATLPSDEARHLADAAIADWLASDRPIEVGEWLRAQSAGPGSGGQATN